MKKMLSVITALSVLSPTLVAAEEAAKASFPAKVAANACSVGGVARLTVTKGKVLLSRGGSFSEIRDGAALSVGDRILVREGSASVVVGQNVVSRVGAGSIGGVGLSLASTTALVSVSSAGGLEADTVHCIAR